MVRFARRRSDVAPRGGSGLPLAAMPDRLGERQGEEGSMRDKSLPTVRVGAVPVADADSATVVEAIARAEERTRLIYALHVGGLASMRSPEYVAALTDADIVYADGVATVLLARLAGARWITRSATTDIGLSVIRHVAEQLHRDIRVALVGGEPGVAPRAGVALEALTGASAVYATDGYRTDDDDLMRELRACRPDVVLVGKGMPLEAVWTHRLRAELPPCVILTCGGWFGFLNGDEPRAPDWMIRANLEWAHRLVLHPRRLLGRYARGVVETILLAPGQLSRRPRRALASDE